MRISLHMVLFTLLFLVTGICSGQDAATQWLTVEQIKRDTALAKEAYERVHPGYTRYTSKAALDSASSATSLACSTQWPLPFFSKT